MSEYADARACWRYVGLVEDIIMAAGLSQKQITSRIYNRLKSLEYQLSKAGVSTQYRKGTANTRGYLVFFEGHDSGHAAGLTP